MVKIRNYWQEQYLTSIKNQINSSLLKFLVLPILPTLLYLTAICTARAGEVVSLTASQSSEKEISYGDQISLNGRILPGAWLQNRSTGGFNTQISDAAARQLIGVVLLNSANPLKQPIQWFSSLTKPVVLTSLFVGGYRYLDITDFAKTAGWQLQVNGNTLMISSAIAKLTDIRQAKQNIGDANGNPPSERLRIVLDLDKPALWRLTKESPVKVSDLPDSSNTEWTIAVDGVADPTLIGRVAEKSSLGKQVIKQLEVIQNQTIIHLSVPLGLSPQVSTLPNPNRLIIDIAPETMVQRDITWAPGLRWREQLVSLGEQRFPVVWLEANPRSFGIKLKPIWANPNTLVGTAPLIKTAQSQLAVAAINGGFFNRNNQLPLGAIRRDNQWVSSPILNRGAIAWNDAGQFYINRLTLLETLIAAPNGNSQQVQLPISTLNSGYIQNGIARYTPSWGLTYTPLSDNETIIVIQDNQVISQLPNVRSGSTAIPIPQNGYLLTLRGSVVTNASTLPIGSSVKIISSTSPSNFSSYPHIVGAGPLLLKNGQIVLDAKAEQFSNAFSLQKAVRSAICTTATGSVVIAAVHNQNGRVGPTLAQHAQLMKFLGCVDALNLDGGSSTSLYLGGQLLDRSPNTAARVHNGIGIFLEPRDGG
ncbi:phosphodiester glycosidase family protein [Aetokthonos hydrillicola Thurmond2011]|jgi:hypothetical protein|uniref:Phosphodiester glycosidase family protein n=1 Tax=Aetokthonos hydrillicola Thurmond2011 TaxID=2712845 RepID=A0AAP5M6V6_9CYAN|nr:phosphodiester glycosidase family protein [Aetokthonos hydrillicola]MBO3460598.1 phosphodiester glycosidase family protein [Aetokthonos hydrillicola CCALA 1050]MBW4587823.1 phosphodiester glycosidase family protein [Aetokthonos hydrillicola CCALA 1050]MDR9894470.1 phosphodiester glycosidase family protein [Aetokthonos hydrillicola Thurmond2011]